MRDFANNVLVKRVLSPVATPADNTAQVGEIIDRLGFESLTYIIATGATGRLIRSRSEWRTAYVMARWTAREAEKVIAREGVFAVGKNGIGKPHPATGLLRSSRDTLARLGFQLGLTPAARARHAAAQPAAKPDGERWDL